MHLFPGSEMVWHSEIEPNACKVLAHHFPGVPNLGDITQVDWAAVAEEYGPIDILTGGFPCQDVSTAGKRAGLAEGTRSGLWSHMCAAVSALRPRYVMVENVNGLLSAKAIRSVELDADDLGIGDDGYILRAIGAVLGDLSEIGYDAQWASVRASAVGAAHRRERVFLLAHPADAEGERQQGLDDGALGETARGGRQRLAAGGAGHGDGVDTLLPTPPAADCTGGGAHPDTREGHSRQLIDYALLHGSSRWGAYEPAIRRQEAVMGRPAPSPTEPNTKGNPRLSAKFAEFLMMWPDGWVTDPEIGLSRNAQLKCVGNGVVPDQAIAAFEYLLTLTD